MNSLLSISTLECFMNSACEKGTYWKQDLVFMYYTCGTSVKPSQLGGVWWSIWDEGQQPPHLIINANL